VVRNLRVQNDSLKTDIQKAKRGPALKGGCKDRAPKIRRLEAVIGGGAGAAHEDAVEVAPARAATGADVQALRAEVDGLAREGEALKLKLRGLISRIAKLEKSGIKERVRANLARSGENDAMIERLRPKKRAPPQRRQFREHVGQQSRLSVVILGLNAELAGRTRELNHAAVVPGEPGLCGEIERMQRRLHLLESSMSCLV